MEIFYNWFITDAAAAWAEVATDQGAEGHLFITDAAAARAEGATDQGAEGHLFITAAAACNWL